MTLWRFLSRLLGCRIVGHDWAFMSEMRDGDPYHRRICRWASCQCIEEWRDHQWRRLSP